MNKLRLVLATVIGTVIFSPVFASESNNEQPVEKTILLESSFDVTGDETVSVNVMCYNQHIARSRSVFRVEPGEHVVWVKAHVRDRFTGSKRIYAAKLNASLTSEEGYLINFNRDENQISLWLQDRETGQLASDIQSGDLRLPLVAPYALRKRQCETSTV